MATIKPKKIKKVSHFDLLFKYGYSNPSFAKELFKIIFPQSEYISFDWSALKAEKDTFQDLRADTLFSTALKNHPKLPFKICLLSEHKSQYTPKVFSQILQYQTRIIQRSLDEWGIAWPVVVVVVYNGKKPWKWPKSFQKGLWGSDFEKIPLFLQKDLLNFGVRVLDLQDSQVAEAIKNQDMKSRGVLNALRRAWDLKADESELMKLISLFDNWTGDRGDSLVLSIGDYLWSVVPGMNKKLWDRLEHSAVREGIFSKGGYMDIKEYIREEARQEGIQEGMQQGMQQGQKQLLLKLLEKGMDVQSVCKYTGFSESDLKKLKNGSSVQKR